MDLTERLRALRIEFESRGLDLPDTDPNPVVQFHRWFDEAVESGMTFPEAMVLATVSAEGRPSARAVLMKGCDQRGVVFFSNYESRKGRELAARPDAALVFVWVALDRQVRVTGRVDRVASGESDAYWESRPPGARAAAAASRQSTPLPDRGALEAAVADLGSGDLPRPDHWGGYRLVPVEWEFWQGRRHRLHDRIQYLPAGDGWTRRRLAP